MHYIDERLAGVRLFSNCTKSELQAVSRLATVVNVSAGKVLTTEGEAGFEFLVILEGTAEVSRHGETVAALGPGDYIGEIALLDRGPRTATVTAATDMSVAAVASADFGGLLDEVPSLARNLLVGMARRVHELDPDAH